jgi:cyclophilin family peptidyl-prolyl cis-trans isomerase
MDVVDKISSVDTDSNDKPHEAVVIERVELPETT